MSLTFNHNSNPKIMITKPIYLVISNRDLTEGRGERVALAYCLSKATAKRLGKGRYVMGTDCEIVELEMVNINVGGKWYIPINDREMLNVDGQWHVSESMMVIQYPSEEDLMEDSKEKALNKEQIMAKALALGLTEKELKILKN